MVDIAVASTPATKAPFSPTGSTSRVSVSRAYVGSVSSPDAAAAIPMIVTTQSKAAHSTIPSSSAITTDR